MEIAAYKGSIKKAVEEARKNILSSDIRYFSEDGFREFDTSLELCEKPADSENTLYSIIEEVLGVKRVILKNPRYGHNPFYDKVYKQEDGLLIISGKCVLFSVLEDIVDDVRDNEKYESFVSDADGILASENEADANSYIGSDFIAAFNEITKKYSEELFYLCEGCVGGAILDEPSVFIKYTDKGKEVLFIDDISDDEWYDVTVRAYEDNEYFYTLNDVLAILENWEEECRETSSLDNFEYKRLGKILATWANFHIDEE